MAFKLQPTSLPGPAQPPFVPLHHKAEKVPLTSITKSELIREIAGKILATSNVNVEFMRNAITFANRFTLMRILGEGTFGVVVLALDNSTKFTVVLKISKERGNNSSLKQEAINQAKINKLDALHTSKFLGYACPCTNTIDSLFVPLHEQTPTSPRSIIISSYSGTTLTDYTHRGIRRPVSNLAHIFYQALQYCQTLTANNLVQRDITPTNMLISGPIETPGSLVFIDLDEVGETCTGAKEYYAISRFYRPLCVLTKRYSPLEMRFSLGAIFYETITHMFLFPTEMNEEDRDTRMLRHIQKVFKVVGRPSDNYIYQIPYNVFTKFFTSTVDDDQTAKPKTPPSYRLTKTVKDAHVLEDRDEKVLMRERIKSGLSRFYILDGVDIETLVDELFHLVWGLIDYNNPIPVQAALSNPFFRRFKKALAVHQIPEPEVSCGPKAEDLPGNPPKHTTDVRTKACTSTFA